MSAGLQQQQRIKANPLRFALLFVVLDPFTGYYERPTMWTAEGACRDLGGVRRGWATGSGFYYPSAASSSISHR
jgi:hypothetical protein